MPSLFIDLLLKTWHFWSTNESGHFLRHNGNWTAKCFILSI